MPGTCISNSKRFENNESSCWKSCVCCVYEALYLFDTISVYCQRRENYVYWCLRLGIKVVYLGKGFPQIEKKMSLVIWSGFESRNSSLSIPAIQIETFICLFDLSVILWTWMRTRKKSFLFSTSKNILWYRKLCSIVTSSLKITKVEILWLSRFTCSLWYYSSQIIWFNQTL